LTVKLNLGCGEQVVEGWINVDYALGAKLARLPLFKNINNKVKLFEYNWDTNIVIQDLRKTFPWKTESIDIIYSSHLLEHLTRKEGLKFLKKSHRVLKKNGIIRIIVPDLEYYVAQYIKKEIPADLFIERLGVLYDESGSSIKQRLSKFLQSPHKCMYDAPALLSALAKAGFNASGKKAFESDISDIEAVELEGRTQNAVIAEGRKRQKA
jgi:SAM-dependent methyltransferase